MTGVAAAEQVAAKLIEAREHLRMAADDLDQAVKALAPVLSGDKQFATEILEQAFARFRHAQLCVDELQVLVLK